MPRACLNGKKSAVLDKYANKKNLENKRYFIIDYNENRIKVIYFILCTNCDRNEKMTNDSAPRSGVTVKECESVS